MKIRFLINGILSFFFFISFFNAQITNNEIWSGKFYPKSINGIQSMNDGMHYTVLSANGIEKYAYTTFQKTEDIATGNFSDYLFSENEEYLLLETQAKAIYRHSKKGIWKVKQRSTNTEFLIFNGGKIQEPTFSPDATKVAFVYKNNLYYQELATKKVVQVTKDGEKDKIINGICDWVYEEEFAFVRHFDWNKNSTQLAYVKFNETEVPKIELSTFQQALYPKMFTFKYPKAGENNAQVSLYIYHLKDKKNTSVDLSSIENYYIPKIKFSKEPNSLFVLTANRHQNKVSINNLDTSSLKINTLFIEEDAAWIDTDNLTLTFLEDNSFIWNSERSGYRHLYHYSANGKKVKPLTSGNWEISNFYGINKKTGNFYYQSTQLGSTQRGVYQSHIKNQRAKLLSPKTGYNNANFSTNFSYFINSHSTINQPPVYTLYNNKGASIKVLEDNNALSLLMKDKKVSEVEFFTIPNTNGDKMNAWMLKPNNFSEEQSYPVLMYVYGGPGSQTVKDQWNTFNYWWFQLLAQKGYIVISVDGRGTGAKGVAYKKATYKNLGKLEIEDQITAAKWLGEKSFIDKTRIGMFGWSYGGYMASLALTKGADVFKTGIAVAPVTNWRYYDTVYTERFMQTPQENANGYDDNSPINHVEKLKGNYLIIHGTGDDNVHFQNTVEMVEALIQANKKFDMMMYPDKNHGIYGGNTRLHLYNKMTQYLLDNL